MLDAPENLSGTPVSQPIPQACRQLGERETAEAVNQPVNRRLSAQPGRPRAVNLSRRASAILGNQDPNSPRAIAACLASIAGLTSTASSVLTGPTALSLLEHG